jgi:hypothetical protein
MTKLQDLLSDDVVNLSTLGTSELSILVESDAAVDSIQFQWEQDGEILSSAEKIETDQIMSSMGGQTYVPVSYLATPGLKAVVIDVYQAGSVLLCRKILSFVVIEYSENSAVQDRICEKWVVQQSQESQEEPEQQPLIINIAPLNLN